MKKGFTLIELLVVIVIIGILATLATVGLNSVRAKARDSKRISDVRQMQSALELYLNDNNGYPTAGAFTIGSPLVSPDGRTTYMSKIPSNPKPWAEGACTGSGAEYVYTSSNTNTYQLSYCLANNVNDITAGNCTAKPGSICDAPTCNCVGKCSGQMDSCGKTVCGAPTVPDVTNVQAVVSSGQLAITWDAVAGASSYDVCIHTSATACTGTNFNTTGGASNNATNSYTATGLSNGTTYNVAVKAKMCSNGVIGADPSTQISKAVADVCTAGPECGTACGDCSAVATECSSLADGQTTTASCSSPGGIATYHGIKVGTQCWLDKNIDVGDILNTAGANPMASVNPPVGGASAGVNKYCWQGSDGSPATSGTDTTRCGTDGGLYTWAMAMYLPSNCNTKIYAGYTGSGVTAKRQGICPVGFHVPSDYEWSLLEYTLDNAVPNPGGTNNPAICSNTNHSWYADNIGAGSGCNDTTLSYGWRGTSSWLNGAGAKLLCSSQYYMNWYYDTGYCTATTASYTTPARPKLPLSGRWSGSTFSTRSNNALLWSSSQQAVDSAWNRIFDKSTTQPNRTNSVNNGVYKTFGISVRCLKD